jgi:hypothetical protein
MNTKHANVLPSGPENLIRNCLRMKPGETLLVVGEEGSWAHYDRALCGLVADAARSMGFTCEVAMAPWTATAADVPADLAGAIARADHTVFFARMADQLRFLGIEGGRSMVACYTLNPAALDDPFARVDHRLFQAMHDLLLARIERAERFTIRCPDGTDLEGRLSISPETGGIGEFAVKPFPVMIYPPLDASSMSGSICLSYPLTSTSTNIYEGSVYEPAAPVLGTVENGVITAFSGEGGEAERMAAHFEKVAEFAGGNAFAVNSWHTGINPLTYCDFRQEDDFERWGTAVFGSPRVTHFHACGNDPGDIAISIYDATIAFDGEVLWEGGRFVFMDDPQVRALLDVYPGNEAAYTMRWDIGVEPRRAA